MQKTKTVLLSSSLVFLLSACMFLPSRKSLDWNDVKNYGEGISLESSNISKASLSFDSDAFKSAMQKADEAAVNRSNVYTFTGEMNKVDRMMSSLREMITIANAKYYAYGTKEYKKKYDDLYDVYLSFYTWYYPFLQHVRDSSTDIYKAFFGEMSKEEVEEYIRGFLYNEETKKLDTEINNIQNEQEEKYTAFVEKVRAGKIKEGDAKWTQFLLDSIANFRQVINKGNIYADIFGYDNYLDYVYEEYYNREYKSDFVEDYADLIDQYVIPMTKYYNEHVDKSVIAPMSKKDLYQRFNSSNIADASCFQGDLLDSYVNMMGGDMLNAYNHLKKSGYYLFSNDSNSMGTAYVSSNMSEPLIFFSKDYQNVMSIAHEFGHYNAAYNNEFNHSFPYDIEETHSQGNEMLLNAYLTDYYKDDVNYDVYKFIQDYNVYDMLSGAILPTAVARVETYLFDNLDKNDEELLAGANEIMAPYRALYGEGYLLVGSYWATPAVSSTGYYISYATSAVASVGVYTQAKEDFNKAKANYEKFVAYPEECENLDEFFTYSGLYSPTAKSTFEKFIPSNLYSF